MKKRSLVFLLLAFSISLNAGLKKVNTDLDYDRANGWWWYEETYKDDETKKVEKVKYKMTAEEKTKLDKEDETKELIRMLIVEQQENKKVNAAILSRLEYAFPNVTPLKTTNIKTGEECDTNSSSDCFVMPVVAEGQQIPVLKEFLREPSPEKSKEWLKWQATYFNHVNKVSHGLRFAYLKHGAEAYPTRTDYSLGDSLVNSQAEKAQSTREAKMIDSIKDRIAVLAFVGKNRLFEEANKIASQVHNWDASYLKEIDKVFVFESEIGRDEFLKEVEIVYGKQRGETSVVEFWKNAKITVRPDLYEQYKIKMTPSVVMFYEDKTKKQNIHQTISVGNMTADIVRKQMMNFLIYNDIFKPEELAAEANWSSPSNRINKPIPAPSDKGIYKDYKEEVNTNDDN